MRAPWQPAPIVPAPTESTAASGAPANPWPPPEGFTPRPYDFLADVERHLEAGEADAEQTPTPTAEETPYLDRLGPQPPAHDHPHAATCHAGHWSRWPRCAVDVQR